LRNQDGQTEVVAEGARLGTLTHRRLPQLRNRGSDLRDSRFGFGDGGGRRRSFTNIVNNTSHRLQTRLPSEPQNEVDRYDPFDRFIPPEICWYSKYDHFTRDIWSLGVLLCYISVGKQLQNSKNLDESVQSIYSASIIPSKHTSRSSTSSSGGGSSSCPTNEPQRRK
jgi:serine/threonine protein kinase